MVRRSKLAVFAAMIASAPATVLAQPVDLPIPAATTDRFPPGVKVVKTAAGPVYADSKGRALYGMDMRTVLRWSPDAAQYCQQACSETWEPLLAPRDAKANVIFPRGYGDRGRAPEGFIPNQKAPDWTVIQGPQGLQWVYKGWHMVYTRKGDKPGSTDLDGSENFTWNTLKYVPPVPEVKAPAGVAPVFARGGYVLANREGRALFTGTCTADCASWKPLPAGLAARATGDWTIRTDGDRAQWAWKGKPVYVSQEADPTMPPTHGKELRP